MKFTGTLKDIGIDYTTMKRTITFIVDDLEAMAEVNKIKDAAKLLITAEKFRVKRSLSANALLWTCLNQMAQVLKTDKEVVYQQMLKRYGQFTYLCIKPEAVNAMADKWKEPLEVIGDVVVNGQKAKQVICYYGSSTYNTKEFSHLLEGVIDEMQELGIQPPTSEEMRIVLERLDDEKKHNSKK